MKKKIALISGTLAVGCLGLIACLYIAVGHYYRNSFAPGTFVNGIYCTGRSIEEINTELQETYAAESLSLQDSEGHQYEIALKEIGFKIDYTSQLEGLQRGKNPFLWIAEFAGEKQATLEPQISFNEELLRQELEKCGILEDNEQLCDVEIQKAEQYELYDGRKHVFDFDAVCIKTEEALYQESFYVDTSDCYKDLEYTKEMLKTLALWEKIEDFQTCDIVYDMGDEEIALTPDIVSKWIMVDEGGAFVLDDAGNPVLNEEAVENFVDELCEEYDTYKSVRTFLSTRGDEILIEGGTYGNKLDKEEEVEYLLTAFREDVNEVHAPAYEIEAYVQGKDDIGDTYIEVDMTEQKLYYYEDGELKLETDVVTGNMKRNWDTPAGVNYIYAMQRNRTLRGAGYATFVKYWVPVVGNIGIHDASWRGQFGGEIYQTNGSHGCINVPSEKMAELYEMVEIGIPVVMFY